MTDQDIIIDDTSIEDEIELNVQSQIDEGIEIEITDKFEENDNLATYKKGGTLSLTNVSPSTIDSLFNELLNGVDRNNQKAVIATLTEKLGNELAASLIEAYNTVSNDELQYDAVNVPGSKWTDNLNKLPQYENNRIQPVSRLPAKGTIESQMRNIGALDYIEVHLPYTGIRLTIAVMDDSAYSLLEMRIAREKVILSQDVYGMRYDISTAVTDEIILDTMLNFVVACDIDIWDKELLRNIIDDRDLDILITRMLLLRYPTGYNVNLICSNIIDSDTSEKCGNIVKRKLSISRLIKYDHSRISKPWLDFSTVVKGKKKIEDVLSHRKNEPLRNDILKIRNYVLKLKTCTTAERAFHARTWVKSINDELIQVFDNRVTNDDFHRRVNMLRATELLRFYIPYIYSITILSGNELEEETTTVLYDENNEINLDPTVKLLNKLSQTDDLKDIIEGIEKFISTNISILPAYHTFNCSKCGKPLSNVSAKRELMPIEARRLFFTIMAARLNNIT